MTCRTIQLLRTLIFTAALVLVGGMAGAAEPVTAFESANRLYEQGKYAEAADAYLAIVSQGKASAEIFFNIGNASYRTGRFGRAIYFYRRAQDLSPRDPDIAANLQFARKQVSGGMMPDPSWHERTLERLSVNEWATLTAIAFWLWLGVIAFGELRPAKKAALGNLRNWGLVSVVVAGACLAITASYRLQKNLAVVVSNEAVVRYGQLAESKSYFNLRDGVEVSVIDQKDEWLQVTDPIQRTGWVRADQIWYLNRDFPTSAASSSHPLATNALSASK